MTTIIKGDGQKKGRQPEKPGGRDFVVIVEQSRDKMAQHFTRIAKTKYPNISSFSKLGVFIVRLSFV